MGGVVTQGIQLASFLGLPYYRSGGERPAFRACPQTCISKKHGGKPGNDTSIQPKVCYRQTFCHHQHSNISSRHLHNASCLQVLSDHLRFVPALELQQAFALNRVLVNGTPVDPSYHLSLGQTVEMIFHRHEPEVRSPWGWKVTVFMRGGGGGGS